MMFFPDNWFAKIVPLIESQGFTILGSISQMHRLPAKIDYDRLIVYNWDVYSWQNYKSGPWQRFGEIMQKARDVWHASSCTKEQTKAIYGFDKGSVIKMFVPTDWLNDDLGDGRYVLMPMRHYLQDAQFTWARKACDELGIPLVHPNHDLPFEKYRHTLQHASIILSHYREASTGGQGMIEGYYSGKPILACRSAYSGAEEYMKSQAYYFSSYENLKDQLKWLFFETPKIDLLRAREWVRENYDIKVMAERINETLHSYK